jgi:hypothetical protein
MEEAIDIKKIEQKAAGISHEDGLLELVMGFCMMAMSIRLISRMFVFMLIVPVLLFGPALGILKKYFTYPRIGYVKLVPDRAKEAIGGIGILTFIFAAILAVVLLYLGRAGEFGVWMKWIPSWAGIVIGVMFVCLRSKTGAHRYWVFAVWSLAVGILLSVRGFETIEAGVLLYFLVMGGGLVVCGFVQFVIFLGKYPKLEQEAANVKE